MEVNSLPVTVTLLVLLHMVTPLDIDLTDGGYRNVVVAISKDLLYNDSIVEDIKSLFQSSSEFLNRATNGRVYFKHVIIDVPHAWPNGGRYRHVSARDYRESDVSIGPEAPPYGDQPFTKQVKGCGARGEYIHLTPRFLAQIRVAKQRQHYENPVYTFVHEWAHFRYGVFDEYGCKGDDQFPLTYCHDHQVKLNSCSARIRFTATRPNGDKCLIKKDCQFTDECEISVFQPSNTLAESSIMFMPYLANVTHFCEAGTGRREHDPHAPNKQNYMCKQKSTWEVISTNKDFQTLPQPDMAKRISVSFEERIRDLPPRVVLVLDVSSSMSGEGRIGFLKEATSRYIREIPDDSQRLAIVTFSSRAEIRHRLQVVNSSSQGGFLNVVEKLSNGGYTCIGCGLELALQVLNTTDEGTEGAVVVLMSDGEENRLPKVKDVLKSVLEASIKVTTLALGPTAYNNLEELALATGGRAYSFTDLREGVALDMQLAFVESSTAQIETGLRPVLVTRSEQTVSRTSELPFMLDATVGKNTIVYAEHDAAARIDLWLVDPACNRCQQCYQNKTGTISSVSIPGHAMAGTWTLHVKSSTPGDVSINVQIKSQASNASDEPVRLSCRVDEPLVASCKAKIFADVTMGRKVVLDAEVVAEVSGPNPPQKSTVRLRDDGHDPDAHRNDGTYSGYFTGFSGTGRYAIVCHVSSQNETRLSYPASCGSGSSFTRKTRSLSDWPGADPSAEYPFSDFILAEKGVEAMSAESFPVKTLGLLQRSATGGAFRVTRNILETDVPPGDIRDLSITNTRLSANNKLLVQLAWTWPGAHLTNGQASGVVIRASKEYKRLMADFDNQVEITEADVVEGNLNPLASGSKHTLTLSVPTYLVYPQESISFDSTAYLAARVANSYGLLSDVSNIVLVLHTLTPWPQLRRAVLSLWMWTVVAAVALFIVIIIAIVVLSFVRKSRRASDESS